MADQNFIDGLRTELGKLNDPELTALRQDVEALKARPVAPSPKAYIVSTWKSGSNWWRKYSDGFIEQGGVVTGIYNKGWVLNNVNLHTPFSNTSYTISVHGIGFTGAVYHGIGCITKKSSSSFSHYFYNGIGEGLSPSWYACGY